MWRTASRAGTLEDVDFFASEAMRVCAGLTTLVKSRHAVFQVCFEGTPEAHKHANASWASLFPVYRRLLSMVTIGAEAIKRAEKRKTPQDNNSG
jgi:hypothetical protein